MLFVTNSLIRLESFLSYITISLLSKFSSLMDMCSGIYLTQILENSFMYLSKEEKKL